MWCWCARSAKALMSGTLRSQLQAIDRTAGKLTCTLGSQSSPDLASPLPPHSGIHSIRTNTPRLIVNDSGKVLRVVPFNEAELDAKALEEDFELVERPSIQVRRRDDVVARFRDGREREELPSAAVPPSLKREALHTYLRGLSG